jgi:hypothetical protein
MQPMMLAATDKWAVSFAPHGACVVGLVEAHSPRLSFVMLAHFFAVFELVRRALKQMDFPAIFATLNTHKN